MNLEQLKDSLADYAKDIKLNLSSVLTTEGSPDLSQKQIDFIALSCSYAIKNKLLTKAIEDKIKNELNETETAAAKSAAVIMAMNNIYYRFTHLVSDTDFAKMPAKLRMNVMMNPGVDKLDFELSSLAISAINGCGMCMDAHVKALVKAGASKSAIQSTVRIASVLNAAGLAIEMNH